MLTRTKMLIGLIVLVLNVFVLLVVKSPKETGKAADYVYIREYKIAGEKGSLFVVSNDYCFFNKEEAEEFMALSEIKKEKENGN